MIRWLIVAALIGAGGCKGSAKPSCDPARPASPSLDWAYAEYLAQGGEKLESRAGLGVVARDSYKGLYDLRHEARSLGTVWKCKLHRDPRQLAKVLLLDEGWAAANAPMRQTLATKIYGELVARPLQKPDPGWDPTQEFTPPQLTALEDTGVQLVHWYTDGAATPTYTREEVIFRPDATISEPKKLASYTRTEPVK